LRLLGVDFGGKRIGLAAVDTDARLPAPLAVLEASGTLAKDAEAIKVVADREAAGAVVVGIPLDLTGETRMSRICRMLGDRLEVLGLKVHYIDESMTSQLAEDTMKESGMTAAQVRKRVDAEAACRILERFLEDNGGQA
jgi:putative Holliday junction resolvase